jgi:hypothetical protein
MANKIINRQQFNPIKIKGIVSKEVSKLSRIKIVILNQVNQVAPVRMMSEMMVVKVQTINHVLIPVP